MQGELIALAALAMFATNIIVIRLASTRLALDAGYVIAVAVNVVGAALMFGVERLFASTPIAWDWLGTFHFTLGGVFSTYFGRWFMLESIARLGPSRASAFQVSSPVFTLAIAWLFLGERLSIDVLIAMAIAGAGLLLVSLSRQSVAPKVSAGAPRASRWQRLVQSGFLLGCGASAAYAISNVFRGAGIRQWNEAILGVLIGSVAGFAMQLVLGKNLRTVFRGIGSARNRDGIRLFVAAGVLTTAAQVCVILAMARSPVAVVSLITLCTPVLVFPLSYFVLKNEEKINARTVIGALLIIAGIGAILSRT